LRDSKRRQNTRLYIIIGMGAIIIVGLILWLSHFKNMLEGSIIEFSLEEPKSLEVNQTEARVCGDLRTEGIQLEDLQIFVYIAGLEPQRSEQWWRSKERCPATKNAGEWTLPSQCNGMCQVL